MKTTATKKTEVKVQWHHIDAEGQVLGRLAADISKKLMGKDKVDYVPYLNTGDKVVVVNAKKVVLTGNKENDKIYRRHSQYFGGLKELTAAQVRKNTPERMIQDAVKGMLPKNRLRDVRMANLYIYNDAEHKHDAQVKSEKQDG